jgi:cellulose synthase operon protein YhjQ
MPMVVLQGLRGGTGATSITAALGWALATLGESVLLIDGGAENQLATHFNAELKETRGWMQALQQGRDWRDSALRYMQGLDLLPFGQLNSLPALKRRYQWLLLDLPVSSQAWQQNIMTQAEAVIRVLTPDANCHLRLHQQHFSANTHFLLNQFNANSKLQQDLHQLWIATLNNLIPLMIHRDEALAESLMMKQPLGEYRPHALASEEVTTLANWLILHVAGVRS